MMLCMQISVVALSAYIFFESLDAISAMAGGMADFCHKAKYALALGAALAFGYFALFGKADVLWLALIAAMTVALFVWPRTVWRVRRYFNELEHLESGL